MTRRSRSSFDLTDALTTAEALSPKPPKVEPELPAFEAKQLVAFGASERETRPPAPVLAPPSVAPTSPAMREERASALPAPPDVSALPSLVPRLSQLLDWLRTDPEVSRALVVDDEGLPLVGSTAGDLGDAESLLAATGSVASAMKKLALATPGTMSPDFEGHVGEGPVLQLVGVTAERRAFVVGISRRHPFADRDVVRIRQAFSAALAGFALGAVRREGAP